MRTTLIRDCLILDVPCRAVRRGSLLLEGGCIARIHEGTPSGLMADVVLDASQQVALPGLVDAHTHLAQTFGRGTMDDLPLTPWLERIWAYRLSPEALYYSTLLGCMDAIRTGTTCVADMLGHDPTGGDASAQAIRDSGLRAVLGQMMDDYQEGQNTPVVDTAQALQNSRQFIARWHGAAGGRITARVAPTGLPAATEALMRGARQLAGEMGVGIHTHASEGKAQTEGSRARFGVGEVEALARFGVLGPDVQLAHTIWVDEAEIRRIAASGAHVVHCPSSNMRLTDGICRVSELQRAGINVALGCDGAASSGSYDMIYEGRLAAMLAKVSSMDAAVMPAPEVLRMMTFNGARALGLESSIGTLEEGKRADVVLLNRRQPHLLGQDRLVSLLSQSACGLDVDTVFIDGEMLLRGGRFTRLSEDDILSQCEKWMATGR